MSTISGFIAAIVSFVMCSAASRRFSEKFRPRILRAAIIGGTTGLVVALAPKVPALLALSVFLFLIGFLMAYVVWWWWENGSTVPELVNVGLVDLMLMWAGSSAAGRVASITDTGWAIGLVRSLPGMIFLISLGAMICNMLYFNEWVNSEEFDPDRYLDGNEKASDFEIKETNSLRSIIKRVWRWVSYEDDANSSVGTSGSAVSDC